MSEESSLEGAVWEIDPSRTWPPPGNPLGPISPSLYETLKECPLRACFGCSSGYKPRTAPKTRLGTAYHDTLARLPSLSRSGLTRVEMRAKAVSWFREAVAAQRAQAGRHSRESGLPWPENQVQSMEISLALKANSVAIHSPSTGDTEQPLEEHHSANSSNSSFREGILVSCDGLIKGRPDLVESGPTGTIIIDYKTGMLDAQVAELRYVRQCLIYAWLWHDQYGTWPTTYRLENPLREQVREGVVDRELAAEIVTDMKLLAQQLPFSGSAADLAQPGSYCRHCAYRPWCEPYWLRVGREAPLPGDEDGTQLISLEGRLIQVDWPSDSPQNVGLFYLTSKETSVTIQVSANKFDYLQSIPVGSSLRVIDAMLTHDVSWLKLTHWSEVFVLRQP